MMSRSTWGMRGACLWKMVEGDSPKTPAKLEGWALEDEQCRAEAQFAHFRRIETSIYQYIFAYGANVSVCVCVRPRFLWDHIYSDAHRRTCSICECVYVCMGVSLKKSELTTTAAADGLHQQNAQAGAALSARPLCSRAWRSSCWLGSPRRFRSKRIQVDRRPEAKMDQNPPCSRSLVQNGRPD